MTHVIAVMMMTTATQAMMIPATQPAPHFCSTGAIGTGVPAVLFCVIMLLIVGGESPVAQPPALTQALAMAWNHPVEVSELRLFRVVVRADRTDGWLCGTFAITTAIKLPCVAFWHLNGYPVLLVKESPMAINNTSSRYANLTGSVFASANNGPKSPAKIAVTITCVVGTRNWPSLFVGAGGKIGKGAGEIPPEYGSTLAGANGAWQTNLVLTLHGRNEVLKKRHV